MRPHILDGLAMISINTDTHYSVLESVLFILIRGSVELVVCVLFVTEAIHAFQDELEKRS